MSALSPEAVQRILRRTVELGLCDLTRELQAHNLGFKPDFLLNCIKEGEFELVETLIQEDFVY